MRRECCRVLPLDLSRFVVALSYGSCQIPVSRHHYECNICLGGTCDHVFDSRGGLCHRSLMAFFGVELLGCASYGDTSLTLLLLTVHVESKGK